MIDQINELYNRGHTIYLYTGRHMDKDKVTKEWLRKHHVFYHHIFYGKPVGDIYIDDLSVKPEEFLKRNKNE